MESKYIIDEKQLQAILSYLAQKPWQEVKDGIAMLSNLPKHGDKINYTAKDKADNLELDIK